MPVLQWSVAARILHAGISPVQKQLRLSTVFMEVSGSAGPFSTGGEWWLQTQAHKMALLPSSWEPCALLCSPRLRWFAVMWVLLYRWLHLLLCLPVSRVGESWTPAVGSTHLRRLWMPSSEKQCLAVPSWCAVVCLVGLAFSWSPA